MIASSPNDDRESTGGCMMTITWHCGSHNQREMFLSRLAVVGESCGLSPDTGRVMGFIG